MTTGANPVRSRIKRSNQYSSGEGKHSAFLKLTFLSSLNYWIIGPLVFGQDVGLICRSRVFLPPLVSG